MQSFFFVLRCERFRSFEPVDRCRVLTVSVPKQRSYFEKSYDGSSFQDSVSVSGQTHRSTITDSRRLCHHVRRKCTLRVRFRSFLRRKLRVPSRSSHTDTILVLGAINKLIFRRWDILREICVTRISIYIYIFFFSFFSVFYDGRTLVLTPWSLALAITVAFVQKNICAPRQTYMLFFYFSHEIFNLQKFQSFGSEEKK